METIESERKEMVGNALPNLRVRTEINFHANGCVTVI